MQRCGGTDNLCTVSGAWCQSACQQCNGAPYGKTSPVVHDSDDLIAVTSLIITLPMKNGLSILVKISVFMLEIT